jgi:hypothetical protein
VLSTHQQTSKKCIKIQQEKNVQDIKVKLFLCSLCDKGLSSKRRLESHILKCKSKKIIIKEEVKTFEEAEEAEEAEEVEEDDIIKTLRNEIKILKDEMKKINTTIVNSSNTVNAVNAVNTVNNTVNNIVNNTTNNTTNNITINNIDFMSYMTEERIREVFDKYYTIQMLLGSEQSLATFTVDNFLSGKDKPIYLCPDKARNTFYFLDEKGKRFDDSNAQILINLIITYGFDSIRNSYTEHIKNFKHAKLEKLDNMFNKIMNLKNDNKNYINHLGNFLPKTIKERKIRDDLNHIQNENKNNPKIVEINDKNTYEDKKIEYDISSSGARCIGEYTLGGLIKYKKHYQNTGEIVYPPGFLNEEENKEKFLYYLGQ